MYQNIQYLSGVTLVFQILLQLNILCTSAVKSYYAKTTIHRFCAPMCQSLSKQKKLENRLRSFAAKTRSSEDPRR